MVPKLRGQKTAYPVSRRHEKRYFPRWEVNKRVEYIEESGAAFRSYTKDLSLDGASIFVFGDPPVKPYVRLKIHLADKENFEAQGRVAWSRSESSHKLFGIVFENLRKKAHGLLIRHAFEIKEEQLLIDRLTAKINAKKESSSPDVPLSFPNGNPSGTASVRGMWPNGGSLRNIS